MTSQSFFFIKGEIVLGNIFSQENKYIFGAQHFDFRAFHVMFIGENNTQNLYVARFCKNWTDAISYAANIAFKQPLFETLLHDGQLGIMSKIVKINCFVVAYLCHQHVELSLLSIYGHFFFLSLVGGIAANTLKGDGIACYWCGAS